MQNLDSALYTPTESDDLPDGPDKVEELVVFRMVVPAAAKIPALRQYVEVAKLLVQPNSVSSTVPGSMVTQLRVNNTAQSTAWCITATVATPPSVRQQLSY